LVSGKNPGEPGIAEERQEAVLLATAIVNPAVRLRNKEEVGRSRQQKKPIPSKDVSWQDLLFRRK